MFKRPISLILILTFLISSLPTKVQADQMPILPKAGTMVSLSVPFQPIIIKGMTVHQDNPFLFDFIVDSGEDKVSNQALKSEGERLIKYFLASLAIPEQDLWVNLSPYEKDRIIPTALGQTDMGRDLLAQDYILKQLTASLIYPEQELGKKFWDKVYAKAQQLYGTTSVPVNTFNKVWIMADQAEIFERNNTAFVTKSHLKVMLEEDYLATVKNQHQSESKSVAKEILRNVIIPEIEHEVNAGKNFANVRQIFNSLILGAWYKKNLKQALLNQVYTGQNKVNGIDIKDKAIKAKIYQQYLTAYKKGVFNYIKDTDTSNGLSQPRKYFAGGIKANVSFAMTTDQTSVARALPEEKGRLSNFTAGVNIGSSKAMTANGAQQAEAVIKFDESIGGAKIVVHQLNSGARIEAIDQLPGKIELKDHTGYAFHFAVEAGELKNMHTEFSLEYKIKRVNALGESEKQELAPNDALAMQLSNGDSIEVAVGTELMILTLRDGKLSMPEFILDTWHDITFYGTDDKPAVKITGAKRVQESGVTKSDLSSFGIARLSNQVNVSNSNSAMTTKNSNPWGSFVAVRILPKAVVHLLLWAYLLGYRIGSIDPQEIQRNKVEMVDSVITFNNTRSVEVRFFTKITPKEIKESLKDIDGLEILLAEVNSGRSELIEIKNDGIDLNGRVVVIQFPNAREYVLRLIRFMRDINNPEKPESFDDGRPKLAIAPPTNGGIDLNTDRMALNVRKKGEGLHMVVDKDLIARIKREGIERLSPVIYRITTIESVWPLFGLKR